MRNLEELKKKLEWAIANIKKCYVGDNTINKSKLKDELMFLFSMNYIIQSVENKLITNEEFYKQITDGYVPSPTEPKEEVEACSQ